MFPVKQNFTITRRNVKAVYQEMSSKGQFLDKETIDDRAAKVTTRILENAIGLKSIPTLRHVTKCRRIMVNSGL